MSLTRELSGEFDAAIRQRGANYFDSGRVRIESGSASHVVATVRGSSRYTVELERDGPEIVASCTCPYFDIGACKHVWAVVLAAASQGFLQSRGRSGKAYLVHADELDDDFDDDDDDGDPMDDGWKEDEYRDVQRYQRPVPARALPPPALPARKGLRQPKAGSWRKQLAQLNSSSAAVESGRAEFWPSTRELLYVIDVPRTQAEGELYVEICFRDLKMDGAWAKPKSQYLRRDVLYHLPDKSDRRILALLAGAKPDHGTNGYGYNYGAGGYLDALPFRYRLSAPQAGWILTTLCQSGRCRLRLAEGDEEPRWVAVNWQESEPWQFRLSARRQGDGHYELAAELLRDGQRMNLISVLLAYGGICFTRESAIPCEPPSALHWITFLRQQGPLRVPAAQRDEFLAELLRQPDLPALDVPEELRYEEVSAAPRPRLTVKPNRWRPGQLQGELSFDYGGAIVAYEERSRAVVQAAQRRVLLRDFAAERAAHERLQRLGWRQPSVSYPGPEIRLELTPRHLPNVVRELTGEGWHVEAEGKVYRSAGGFNIQVTSGIDWFELHGGVEFGDTVAPLPELLAALRRGESTVKLGDGTFGLLPEDWLSRYGLLAGLGTPQEGHLRFRRSQVGLLDALLAAHPETQCDALFAQARDELRRFTGVEPADPPVGFRGELRPYQQEGLGWLHFLRKFGFGGCLADDMGLGKTVQVLALLEARRELRGRLGERSAVRKGERSGRPDPSAVGPSLVVVPKSLIFNWKEEAARFAPRLRVLDHTGTLRQKSNGHFADHDVVLTTYGTLRNDTADFKDFRFDYLILDEAQAIKNANSASAKAARLLQGDHRLALSGTPIENHLGELWSLFEFLNPGMLGAASVFKLTHGAGPPLRPATTRSGAPGNGLRNPDDETRGLLAQALRPFLLRRTKEQVMRDLPPKVEQTLYCELESKQRRLYDELREHYRQALLKRIEREGIQRAKIQILEALLRLRQAAIHPGLLDKQRRGEPSAKLDMLLPRLQEVIEEGHKTLVFSQFTGMLSILRGHLDREGVAYAYLDGKTRDRQACVERFQTDPDCRLFLISLKAGGLGLNLTAAQYVFLLDPWWNPAVEAQAVDRAHRIGQRNQVFAYRLIARGTVEEKVLELQNTKRELADAIVGADNSLIRNLGKEDLQLLLS